MIGLLKTLLGITLFQAVDATLVNAVFQINT